MCSVNVDILINEHLCVVCVDILINEHTFCLCMQGGVCVDVAILINEHASIRVCVCAGWLMLVDKDRRGGNGSSVSMMFVLSSLCAH